MTEESFKVQIFRSTDLTYQRQRSLLQPQMPIFKKEESFKVKELATALGADI
jgi:hypothetical protein